MVSSFLATGAVMVTSYMVVGMESLVSMVVVMASLASMVGADCIFGFGKTRWVVIWNCFRLSFIVLLGWGDFIFPSDFFA